MFALLFKQSVQVSSGDTSWQTHLCCMNSKPYRYLKTPTIGITSVITQQWKGSFIRDLYMWLMRWKGRLQNKASTKCWINAILEISNTVTSVAKKLTLQQCEMKANRIIRPTKYQTSEREKVTKKIVLDIHFYFLFAFNKKHTLIASQRKQNSTSTPLPPKANSSSSFFTSKRRSVL